MFRWCSCCARPGAVHALEQSILQIVASIERTTRAQATLTSVQRYSGAVIWLWPVVVGIAAMLIQRFTPAHVLRQHASNVPLLLAVATLVLLPMLIALASTRVASVLHRRWSAHIASSTEKKHVVLERIKKELPMHEALVLLSRYDPTGNHAALIEAPPHLLERIGSLESKLAEAEAEKAGLLTVVDHVLEQLGRNAPGGWAQARGLVEAVTPAIAKHRSALPATANLLGDHASSWDARIMSAVVRTPATVHRSAAASAAPTPGPSSSSVAAALAEAAAPLHTGVQAAAERSNANVGGKEDEDD